MLRTYQMSMYERICSTPTDKTDITKSGVIVVVRELRLSRNLTSSRHSSSSNLGGGRVDVRIVIRNKVESEGRLSTLAAQSGLLGRSTGGSK